MRGWVIALGFALILGCGIWAVHVLEAMYP
jgi:hypothetical protein